MLRYPDAEAAAEGGERTNLGVRILNRWHNYYQDDHPHFCTATITDWKPMLQGANVNVLYDVWNESRIKLGVKVLAYVVMPDHYHVILESGEGKAVTEFLRRTASLTSKRLQPGGGLWKERPMVLPIHSADVLRTKVDYIHRNPLRKELVLNPEDWLHSSFRQLVMGEIGAAFVCDDWGHISL
ncbi:MAG: transposase [Armatimonadetes bacterium]|nr:transposase [Armatimonadota bacterium]